MATPDPSGRSSPWRPTHQGSADHVSTVDRLNRWTRTELPDLNGEILAHRRPPTDFARELTGGVLGDLPAPESLPVPQALRLVVLLGLAGASLGRHYQESDPSHRDSPERAFGAVPVGAERTPFPEYFARLADATHTGHCHRDAYASLVRWNLPTTEVRWAGDRVAALPGVFDDGAARTYTGAPDEHRFFELLKLSETLELAVNTVLAPVLAETVDLRGDEALHEVGLATVLLDELRRLNTLFADLPASSGLRPHYFLDVFRQYAVHWVPGDIPPSGALDPEAIERDLLLGTTLPGYRQRIRDLMPALLGVERTRLGGLLDRPSLPEIALGACGVLAADRSDLSLSGQRDLAGRHPILAAVYLLLTAHARVAGTHLRLTKKFLFDPQRQRDLAGLGDPGVVSNRRGTTGMDESLLASLARARQGHALTFLRGVPTGELEASTHLVALRGLVPTDLRDLVGFVAPGGDWWSAPPIIRPPVVRQRTER